jgi:uncharacterized membrane protein
MALLLRAGVIASLAVLFAAIGTDLAEHPHATWTPSEANPADGFLSLSGLSAGLAAGSPVAFLTLGILLLLATPLLRVLAGLYYFGRHGERTIATIALVVFVLLLVGLFVVGPLVR